MSFSSELQNNYVSWLRNRYNFTDLSQDVVKIETPFLDSSFDYIVMYVERLKNDKLIITDDGWTIDNLISEGISFSKQSKTRIKMLDEIATSFGVDYDLSTKEVSIRTDIDQFPEAKHRLLLALMRINDLSFFNTTNVKNSFVDDVKDLLDLNDILYSPNIIIPGSGGLNFHFDFSVPVVGANEKLVRTIATPNNINQSKLMAYDVSLASKTRKAKYISILNDVRKPINNMNAIHTISDESNYPFQVIPFSKVQIEPEIVSNKAV